jgi:hypothetical protein
VEAGSLQHWRLLVGELVDDLGPGGHFPPHAFDGLYEVWVGVSLYAGILLSL